MERSITLASDAFDRLLSVLCALVAAGTLTLLVLDVNVFVRDPMRVESDAAIAKLQSMENDVRRRPRDMPVWGAARLADDLHLKDYVFTDKGSGAVLAFNDGSSIELGESSLVVIEKVQDHSVLNVIKGSLRAKTAPGASPVVIKVDGQETLVRSQPGSVLQLRVKQGGAAELTVVSGHATVGTAGTVVGAQERTTFTKADAVEAPKPLALTLEAPADGTTIAAAATARLAWRAATAATVEVATDDAFTHVVATATLTEHAFDVPNLAPGTYRWRVRNGTDISEERRFKIAAPVVPQPLSPADGQELRILGANATTTLAWEQIKEAAGYDVEVATDAAFAAPLIASRAQAPSLTTKALPSGAYHWRVRAVGGAWSKPAAFALRSVPPPAMPVVTTPEPDAGIAPGVVGFTWSPVDGAHGYALEIRAGDQVVVRHDLAGTTDSWTATEGTYTWRVTAKDAYGRSSAPSTARALVVRADAPPPKPVLKAPILPQRLEILLPANTRPTPKKTFWERLRALVEGTAFGDAKPATSVLWPPVDEAHGYQVEIALDPEFRDRIVHETVTSPEWKPHGILPGEYYLRVAALDADGHPGPYSNTCVLVASKAQTIDVPPLPKKLASPERLAPVNGQKIEAAVTVVGFTWRPVRGAAAYVVEVRRDDDGDDVIVAKHTRGQDLNVELKPGRYVWRLHAVGADGAAGELDEAWRFEVSQKLEPAPVVVEAPAVPAEAAPAKPAEAAAAGEPSGGRLSLAFSPTAYSYAGTGDDPHTHIAAKLFNSVIAAGRWQATGLLAPSLRVTRTSTILFRAQAAGDPQGQKALHLAPYSVDAVVGLTFGWLELRPGFLLRNVARFRRSADQTLTLAHERVTAPSLGLGVSGALTSLWHLQLTADAARSATTRVSRGSLTLTRDLLDSPFGIDFGLDATKAVDELDHQEIETRTTAVALGLGWRW